MSVGRELDLPQVLRGIVEAAVVLVDAEYRALGVNSPTGAVPPGLPSRVRGSPADCATWRSAPRDWAAGWTSQRGSTVSRALAWSGRCPWTRPGCDRRRRSYCFAVPMSCSCTWAAMTAAWTRRSTPSFPSSREMWFLTVFSDR